MVSELDYVARSAISGIPKNYKNVYFACNILNCGYVRKWSSGHKNLLRRQLYIRYFGHVASIKWFQNYTRTSGKCFIKYIWFLGPFLIDIPIITSHSMTI